MSNFTKCIGKQFGNPHGLVGKICCFLMNVINKAMYKKTCSLLELSPNAKHLDIGYGNGYLLKRIYKKFKCNLYGIDISKDMKNLATLKNKHALKDSKLNLFIGDCCNLKFDDNFFDSVSSINTVYFWSDTIKGLTEIKRCLKPNAKFYNVVYSKTWLDNLSYTKQGFTKLTEQELVALGKQAGFSTVEVKQIVKEKSFVVIYTK